MKNTIKINGEEYVIKYTIRALFMWEQITGKAFKISTLLDNYIFFYCMLIANNKDKVLDWDSYLDALDNDTTLFAQMTDIVNKAEEEKKIFDNSSASDTTDKDGEKKKLSVSELYAILVLELRLPPHYVLDEMDWYEINSLLKYRYYAYKESWEQTRLITYMTAQVNSSKHLKVTDIITFPWEEEEKEENTRITEDDVKRLKAMADNYLSNKNKEKEK